MTEQWFKSSKAVICNKFLIHIKSTLAGEEKKILNLGSFLRENKSHHLNTWLSRYMLKFWRNFLEYTSLKQILRVMIKMFITCKEAKHRFLR